MNELRRAAKSASPTLAPARSRLNRDDRNVLRVTREELEIVDINGSNEPTAGQIGNGDDESVDGEC